MPKFYYCKCFYTHNIFIKKYRQHFIYYNDTQFWKEYEIVLKEHRCKNEEDKNILLEEIHQEVKRRKQIEQDSLEREGTIKKYYTPLHPEVYILKESYLHPTFVKLAILAHDAKPESKLQFLDVISQEKQVFGFPLFTEEFCSILLEELQNFEHSVIPKGRPNTMNKYGIILNELGFNNNFLDPLRINYLGHIAKLQYPDWCGDELDSHRAFTVNYDVIQDKDLDFHYDNAEVTLNVCLGKEFLGGELYFGNMRNIPVSEAKYMLFSHKVGYGIIHRGQQMHGAFPITSGERDNLIIWMRSSSIRNKLCPMCDRPPVLLPSHGYGDGFTASNKQNFIHQICNAI